MARAAAGRRIPGWERLLTATDHAERAALRTTLVGAIEDADKGLSPDAARQLEVIVQRGVAQAFD